MGCFIFVSTSYVQTRSFLLNLELNTPFEGREVNRELDKNILSICFHRFFSYLTTASIHRNSSPIYTFYIISILFLSLSIQHGDK